MTSVHSCVRCCFSLKGQCHKIFCFMFFYESSSPKPLKIRTFFDLQNLLQLRTFRMCGDLRIYNLRTHYFLQFAICWPKFVADLQLLQICIFFIFLLTTTYLTCCNINFYQLKNFAKQACSQLLDSFAIKGGNFKKYV